MALTERIDEELKQAMKARDQTRMDTLRMVKADFKNAQINKGSALVEDEMLGIIQKSIKKRQDAVVMFTTGGRQDLVNKETREMEILKAYVPEQMGEPEIKQLALEAISQSAAASKKDMGKVMGILMPKVKGRCDGRLVQQIVSSLLPG